MTGDQEERDLEFFNKENLEILSDDKASEQKAKKKKLVASLANKKGYRDLVMSTEGISLNIVENATSDK